MRIVERDSIHYEVTVTETRGGGKAFLVVRRAGKGGVLYCDSSCSRVGEDEKITDAKIVRFLESDLAKRMAQSASKGLLRREQPFVLGLRASRLGGEFPDSEQVLIQGIIDVFFEEEGKIVVADYKTDAVKTSEELVKRYQVQLDYYSEALMRLTGKEVTEKIIYSFALGREIMLY